MSWEYSYIKREFMSAMCPARFKSVHPVDGIASLA